MTERKDRPLKRTVFFNGTVAKITALLKGLNLS